MHKSFDWLRSIPKRFYVLAMATIMAISLPAALNALGTANQTNTNTGQPNFSFTKQVRKQGDTAWQKSVTVNPGDTIEYRLEYKNTSTAEQRDVLVKDKLPSGLTYIDGSTKLTNSNNPQGTTLNGDIFNKTLNLGNYAPNTNAIITYQAKVTVDNLTCGSSVSFSSTAGAAIQEGTKHAEASVKVEKNCEQTPVYQCNALSIDKISQDSFKFSVKYTANNGATFKKVTYKVYNSANNEVYSSDNGKFEGFKPGKYTVKAFITVALKDSEKTVTSEDCTKAFVISDGEKPTTKKPGVKVEKLVDGEKHKSVKLNTEFTYQIKVTNTGETDLKNIAATDNAPKGVTFVKASAGTIKDNKWTHTIAELKSGQSISFTITAKIPTAQDGKIKNTACVDAPGVANPNANTPDSCDDATVEISKPTTPTNPSNPNKPTEPSKPTNPTVPEKPSNLSSPAKPTTPTSPSSPTKPSAQTPTNPETTPSNPKSARPSSLPQTGSSDLLMSGLGVGALLTAGLAYVASRRQL